MTNVFISRQELKLNVELFPETSPETFSEQPRSINASFKNKNLNQNSDKDSKTKKKDTNEDKEDEEDEKETLPFTVVRVSSTVSHVRPTIELQSESAEDTTVATATTTPESTPSNSTTTTTKKGSRPPFLKPLTKFPDIKIPGLEVTTSTSSPATKVRLSIFSRKPGLFHPTATTAETTAASTADTTVATTADVTTAAATSDSTTAATPAAASVTSPSTTATPDLTTLSETTVKNAADALEESRTVSETTTSSAGATTSRGISTTVQAATSFEPTTTNQPNDDDTTLAVDGDEAGTEASKEDSATEFSVSDIFDELVTTERSIDDESATEFLPETTPDGATHRPNENRVAGTGGRAGSRFKEFLITLDLFIIAPRK